MIHLKGRFGRRSETVPTETGNTLHSIERMQAILNRERMRSDRGNSTFSLLVLEFPSRFEAGELATLGRIIGARIRITDDAGRLAPHQLGIVLPETPVEGARKLAEDLLALLPKTVRRPHSEIYFYPTDVDGECDSLDANGDAGEPNDRRLHNGHTGGVATPAFTQVEKPMQVLFIKPLPAWKRAIDIVGAATALVVLSPLLAAVAIAIKLTSPGPTVFKQQRDTIGGRRFMIYKFRTMCVDAEQKKAALRAYSEQDGPAFKITNDPRVTRLGHFLRVTSIDELPQLVNVLMGDMTLVGPRAMDSKESDQCEQWQRRRLDVTAGLTCIWQVRGRSAVSFAEWMRMDLTYIHSRSLVNDLKLIAETVPAVLLRRGAC